MISRNDQQTQKHILHFISTLHFQNRGRIQNGAQDWQTFSIIKNTGVMKFGTNYSINSPSYFTETVSVFKGMTSHYSDVKN